MMMSSAENSLPAENLPVIILVEPQLAENIGMVARAMANFGLRELRMISPRGGWPKKGAHSAASGATHILNEARIFDDLQHALADITYVFATTARERGQMKQVFSPDQAMQQGHLLVQQENRIAIMFGRERVGLTNEEVALADAIITFPVSPDFPSLNLAQSVLLVAYEWQKTRNKPLPFSGGTRSARASRETLLSFLSFIERELDGSSYYTLERKPHMLRNMRDIFYRREMTEQDVKTLWGIFNALIRKGKNDDKPLL